MRLPLPKTFQCFFKFSGIVLKYSPLPPSVSGLASLRKQCTTIQCQLQEICVKISIASWASVLNVLLFISGCVGRADSWNIFQMQSEICTVKECQQPCIVEIKGPPASPASMLHEQGQCQSYYCIPGALALCPAHRRCPQIKQSWSRWQNRLTQLARVEVLLYGLGRKGRRPGKARTTWGVFALFNVAATT